MYAEETKEVIIKPKAISPRPSHQDTSKPDIQTREQELLAKARELEEEMHSIKKAKIDALLTQFEYQLIKDS